MSSFFELRVGDSLNVADNSLCYYYADTMPKNTTLQWYCSQPISGSYVSVSKVAGVAGKPLVILELEVYPPTGKPPHIQYQ